MLGDCAQDLHPDQQQKFRRNLNSGSKFGVEEGKAVVW